MGLESSQEPIEQEQPRLATSTDTDLSPVVQEDSEGEQLPSHIITAPTTPGFDKLVACLLSWIRTPDWLTSQTYLQAHSELLTETAEQVLGAFVQQERDQEVRELMLLHRQLLQ